MGQNGDDTCAHASRQVIDLLSVRLHRRTEAGVTRLLLGSGQRRVSDGLFGISARRAAHQASMAAAVTGRERK